MTTPAYVVMLRRPTFTLALVGIAIASETILEVALGRITAGPSFGPLLFKGQPFESLAIAWFVAAVALERATTATAAIERFRVYRLAWSAVGLALVVWAIVIGRSTRVPFQYYFIEASIIAAFVVATVSNDGPILPVIRFAWKDFAWFSRRFDTWVALTLAAGVLMLPEKVDTENIRSGLDFQTWFLSQPRVPFPGALPHSRVLVAEFIDYQCPVCKARDARYERVFRELHAKYGDRIQIRRYDFPLERECNGAHGMRDVHPAACEAAAAVRIARQLGQEGMMQQWLWKNQDGLSRDLIFDHLRDTLGIADPVGRYAAALDDIKRDAALGAALTIKSTPTVWVNGVLLSAASERSLRWAILHELQASLRAQNTGSE